MVLKLHLGTKNLRQANFPLLVMQARPCQKVTILTNLISSGANEYYWGILVSNVKVLDKMMSNFTLYNSLWYIYTRTLRLVLPPVLQKTKLQTFLNLGMMSFLVFISDWW